MSFLLKISICKKEKVRFGCWTLYSSVPNKPVCTYISGKVCFLTLIVAKGEIKSKTDWRRRRAEDSPKKRNERLLTLLRNYSSRQKKTKPSISFLGESTT